MNNTGCFGSHSPSATSSSRGRRGESSRAPPSLLTTPAFVESASACEAMEDDVSPFIVFALAFAVDVARSRSTSTSSRPQSRKSKVFAREPSPNPTTCSSMSASTHDDARRRIKATRASGSSAPSSASSAHVIPRRRMRDAARKDLGLCFDCEKDGSLAKNKNTHRIRRRAARGR